MAYNKRILKEFKNINDEPIEFIKISADGDNLLRWYFIMSGQDDYTGGEYIGMVTIEPSFPMTPPVFQMLTPSGRFEIAKNICLSNSHYHTESWSPLWTIRSLIVGLYSVFHSVTKGKEDTTGIAHMSTDPETRKKFALKSQAYNKEKHAVIMAMFDKDPPVVAQKVPTTKN
jgi:ubiquitin-conjugating enzyme E2 J2